MLALRRTVRFSINDEDHQSRGVNGSAGSPPMSGLGRYYELDVTCRGEPDPATGYLIDIKTIDDAVRRVAVPLVADACRTRPRTDPATLLPALAGALAPVLPAALVSLRFRLTPTWSITMTTDAPAAVVLRQQFEFAASHRLHAPRLSDEENRRVFGKCNNPAGHGHNYRIEPAVEVAMGPTPGDMDLPRLESLVDQHLIAWLDHKHLNTDLPEFDPARGGVIPSVENIARRCYERLVAALSGRPGVHLRSVTVWETDRTSCEYPAR